MGFNQELLQEVDIISISENSLFGQEFRNSYGSIRGSKVRNQFDVGNIILPDVIDLYEEWMKDDEYLILKGVKDRIQESFDDEGKLLDCNDVVLSNTVYRFIKASKRGNDVYQYLVGKKLKPLNDLPDVTFFKDDWGVKNTSLLFVTLTYDTKRCDEVTAWENIGKDFHLFYTKLRQEYGDFEYFRTWESTKNCYPHAHILIAFKKKSFPVFIHTDKDGHRTFRIPKADKDKIASFWHSNVDVQGVNGTKDAIDELTKYVTKDLCSDKGHKTNAMIWLFGKQSYAITKGFVSLIKNCFACVTEEVDVGEPSMDDLINSDMCNCNNDVHDWKFVGVLRGRQLGFSGSMWVVDVEKPPPKLNDLIQKEALRWNSLRGILCFSDLKKDFWNRIKENFVRCDGCGEDSKWKDMSVINGVRVCSNCCPKEKTKRG